MKSGCHGGRERGALCGEAKKEQRWVVLYAFVRKVHEGLKLAKLLVAFRVRLIYACKLV